MSDLFVLLSDRGFSCDLAYYWYTSLDAVVNCDDLFVGYLHSLQGFIYSLYCTGVITREVFSICNVELLEKCCDLSNLGKDEENE